MKNPEKDKPADQKTDESAEQLEGYPHYPKSEDIYSKFKEEQNIDPEDVTRLKDFNPLEDVVPDEDFEADEEIMGTDLDVPGADLDDETEDIGNEDEENNYYSIGGDNHNDLEEDHGESEIE